MQSLEILISTMNQKDFSLIKRMNIQTNAIIVNQCNHYAFHELNHNGFVVKWFDVAERGLSKSRNIALSKSNSDICLLVDDDEILNDSYGEIIKNEFVLNKKASIITFNLESIGNISKRYINKKRKKLYFFNIMRYGSARIAFRRNDVLNKRIYFAPNFGAGAEISCGEDSLFLHDCLVKGLNLYTSPKYIAKINDEECNSSWFMGYNEKYFTDLGSIFAVMSPRFCNLWILQYIIRHKKTTRQLGVRKVLRCMFDGKKLF